MAEIIYRDARVEDAEQIVSFYNYVGGETSFLSFEKDESLELTSFFISLRYFFLKI